MMDLPFLADGFLVRATPAASLRRAALDRFGTLALAVETAAPALVEFQPEPGSRWRDLVAAELLLAGWLQRTVEERLVDRFGEGRPFGAAGPPLREVFGLPGACAVIPLADYDLHAEPPAAVIWVVKDDGDRLGPGDLRLSGRIPAGWKTWALTGRDEDDIPIEGESWTLAAALARLASASNPEAVEARRALARDWIITGACNMNGEVSRVLINNKVNLRTDRQWLFPEENRRDLIGYEGRLKRVQLAATETAAWSRITGRGVVHGGEVVWPERVDVLHSFVSQAREPVVASALLSGAKRVILWHSEDQRSRDAARDVEMILNEVGRCQPATQRLSGWVSSRSISSSDLAEVRRTLDRELEKDLAPGVPVLFNVTNGNRLMSYAPLTLSQIHPHLWLVYRDIDAPPLQFNVIRYEGLQPVTQVTPSVAPSSPWVVNWEVLFRRSGEPRGRATAEELARELCQCPESTTAGPLS